jgi:hypothetical protein
VQIGWASGTSAGNSSADVNLSRQATSVVQIGTTGNNSLGWLNSASTSRLNADLTNATATMANVVLSRSTTLIAGRKYFGTLKLKVNNSVAAEGIQLDFNGGTATTSSFWAAAHIDVSSGTDVIGTPIATTLAGAMTFTTITGETLITVDFSFVCTASTGAGTFIPRMAEATHTTGTVTVELGSFMRIDDTP